VEKTTTKKIIISVTMLLFSRSSASVFQRQRLWFDGGGGGETPLVLVNCMPGLSSPIVPYTGLEDDRKESKISLLSFSSTVLQTSITLCSGCGLMAMAGPLTCLYCLVAKRNTSLTDIFRLYSLF